MTPEEIARNLIHAIDGERPYDWRQENDIKVAISAIQIAVRRERERCAKIAEDMAIDKNKHKSKGFGQYRRGAYTRAFEIAEAIRKEPDE